MKHLTLTLLLCWALAVPTWAQVTTIHVKNLAELVLALKSDRVVIIDQDIDFGDGLQRLHDQNPRLLPICQTYDNEKQLSKIKNQCFANHETDGLQLYLKDIHNLTIKSGDPNRLKLLRIEPRYAWVLSFLDCSDIRIENLVMGHTVGGFCSGGVLQFEGCQRISIDHCDLYGCGTEGITCRQVSDLTMTDSYIRNCSYDIMTLVASSQLAFRRCFFFDNREYDLLEIRDCPSVLFEDCCLSNNQGHLYDVQQSHVTMRRCMINHQDTPSRVSYGQTDTIEFDNCIFGPNPGVKEDEED